MSKFNHSILLQAAFTNQYKLGKESTYGVRISRLLENTSASSLRAIAIGSSKPVEKWVGNRSTKPLKDFKLEVQNELYETNFSIPRETWERNEANLFADESRQMGNYMADHWSKLVAQTLIANPTWYDGVNLFGIHPVINTTQVNDLTSTEIASASIVLNTQPSAEEAGDIINETLIYINSVIVNDANVAINFSAKRFLIICGTAKMAGAYRSAIMRQNLSSGSTSPVDGLIRSGYVIDVVLDNALSAGTTKVYFAVEDMANKAFILHSESNVRFELTGTGNNDSLAFQTNAVQVGCSQMRSLALGDYTKIFRLTHATA